MREKLNVLRKCTGGLISAMVGALRVALYGVLLPTIVICQGLTVPIPITSQNHSNPKLAIQTDLIGQPIQVLWSGFSPNGKFFAVAEGVDINFWEVESGKLLKTFKGKPSEKHHYSWSVAFSPDSKLLASGSDRNALRVWDIESGDELKSFEGKDERVNSIAFSPDGKLLASGGEYKVIRLWDVGSGREIKTFEGHDAAVRLIVFSPNGKQLASTSSHKTIKLWDIESGKILESFDVNYVAWMDFALKGKVLFIANFDNTFSFRDIENQKEMESLNNITRGVKNMIFSPDGKIIVGSKSGEKTIRLWDIESGKELQSLEPDTKSGLNSMIFSPDSKVLAINSGKTINFWNIKSKKLLKSMNSQFAFLGRFLPDGKVLGFWHRNKTIYRWDFKSGNEFKSILK